ncbi:unnamed protein product [Allacma fusca]|uniref:Uncharacterized protein n=1 Tax=Allacma fusca TaxID=39272 RepID=A0A8J2LX56_9HEXA|nr:unnamed protein product [Allacma fusca]
MYEVNGNSEGSHKASKGLRSSDSEKRSNLCCRALIASLGYFNLMWFCYWLLEIQLYEDVMVTGRCIEIPEDSNAFVTCGALYCANRIADLITGVVLLIGIHMRNPAFLQAFVLYEMFTFISWNIIFVLQWNYASSPGGDQMEYTLYFLLRRVLQVFFMYVVIAFQKDMQMENEEKKNSAVRFYI